MKLKTLQTAPVFQSCTARVRSSWQAMNSQIYKVKDFNMWLALLVDLLHEPKLAAHIVRSEPGQRKLGWRVLKNSSIGEFYILESEISAYKPDVANHLSSLLVGFSHSRLPVLFTDLGDGGNRTLVISLDIIPGTANTFERALRFAVTKQTSILN